MCNCRPFVHLKKKNNQTAEEVEKRNKIYMTKQRVNVHDTSETMCPVLYAARFKNTYIHKLCWSQMLKVLTLNMINKQLDWPMMWTATLIISENVEAVDLVANKIQCNTIWLSLVFLTFWRMIFDRTLCTLYTLLALWPFVWCVPYVHLLYFSYLDQHKYAFRAPKPLDTRIQSNNFSNSILYSIEC